MKKLIFLTLITCLVATGSFAATDPFNSVPFANMSAASAAVKNSAVYDVRTLSVKTLSVSGVTLTSSPSVITFKNMSGTVLAQCGPTATGPWATCISDGYAQTAVSRTTNGIFTWRDATAYVRLNWTSGTIGGKLKAWLNATK